MKSKAKYYVVFSGRKTGIMRTWAECAAATHGFSGAQFKSFSTLNEARHALASFQKHHTPTPPDASPKVPSICVDAACNTATGTMEYRAVELASRKELFRNGPFAHATNNVGEFLAIVHALAYCKKHHLNWPIYSDSKTALTWVRRKKARTTLKADKLNRDVFELLRRAELWLREHNYTNELLQWNTPLWGENPADFGRK
ncbi:MAG: ribonuclease H family protein [Chitinophagales bacterium]|nr:ribonuclease H family protein [Chitinophagales bacterium]MDW8427508.1 ribonuclease H family protein [Chitinophagales bacterium]